jgi:phosphoribosylpyrophosphate synthetase
VFTPGSAFLSPKRAVAKKNGTRVQGIGTVREGARVARKAGAKRVIAPVAHGLFIPGAAEVIADPAIERFTVTDIVPPVRLEPGAVAE